MTWHVFILTNATISPDQELDAMAARNAALEEQTRRQAEEQRAEIDAVKAANSQLQAQMAWLAVSFMRITC